MLHLDRRAFLAGAGSAGASLLFPGCLSTRAADRLLVRDRKLRYAAIGTGGMGLVDLQRIAAHPEVEVVALCDVDTAMFEQTAEVAPLARRFQDWRVLLAELGDSLDAVHVTTPDHMHAPIAMQAMARRLHVYCQKPLTRTVAEARAMARRARDSGVVTQMGIQNHNNENLTSARALWQQKPIGAVYEAHVWTDRPAGWWPQGVERLAGEDEMPATLDWDLWIGTAPYRPYKKGYHPFAWRGREDFGTGAQGDMACHLMDAPLWFLELGLPLTVRSDGPVPNGESYPLWSRVQYTFAATPHTTRGPIHLTWYDGGKLPPVDLLAELGTDRESIPKNACLLVGTDGGMIVDPYGPPVLLPANKFEGQTIPQLQGMNHWHEWVDACRGGPAPKATFDYAAHLTEVALLGNIALRFPHETLRYDGAAMRFVARPEADAWLSSPVRAGWEVDGLG